MENRTTSKTITLKSNDGKEFVVPEAVAMQLQPIRHTMEVDCAQGSIPLPNVSSQILEKVINYCQQHVDAADASKTEKAKDGNSTAPASSSMSDKELTSWEKQFLDVDLNTLHDLIMAADYLAIKGLLDLTCKKVADVIKGKMPEEIRQTFNIKNDFTAEEEEEIRLEHPWAFE